MEKIITCPRTNSIDCLAKNDFSMPELQINYYWKMTGRGITWKLLDPLLLTWVNFDHSMETWICVGWNNLSTHICIGEAVDVWESLRWRHNGCDSVSNHQPRECLLRRLIRRTSKKTSKLRVTGLCAGNSPETGEFPAQMASNAENVSIWWRHHDEVNSTNTLLGMWLLPNAKIKVNPC